MTKVIVREDEHASVFEDTRTFAANKWATAVDALDLGAADTAKAQIIDAHDKFARWLFQSIHESLNASQKGYLQTLQLLAQPLWTFTGSFEDLVHPAKVDMSILWGLVYLNIKLALASFNETRTVNEKLKNITKWLSSLRRAVDSLNQCLANCRNTDSARRDITDVFEPMLQLLTEMIKFQHTYVKDTAFHEKLGTMNESVNSNINDILEIVNHFRQISEHSKVNQEAQTDSQVTRLAFRERDDPNDFTAFPVDNIPQLRTEKFYGRESSLQKIDAYLGDHGLEKLRTYVLYGRRGVGKTQIALEYARRGKSKFDAVFWIRCETSASLRQSFADIAVLLELYGADKHGHFQENQIKVLTWLKATKKTWLLIFDNAEREQLLDAYWPKDARGSILVTSRAHYNFEKQEARHGETVPVFNDEERWELLMELLGEEWQLENLCGKQGSIERLAARELMSKLDGLALAIAQAARLVLETRITADRSVYTLLQLFEENRQTLAPRQMGHRDSVNHALDTVWSIALNALSPNARRLLGVFAMLSPDGIPVDLFLPSNQSRLNGSLDFCKQNESTSATEISEPMRVVIKELKIAGLIQQDNRIFTIHRVIQEAMNYDNINALQEAFDATTQLLVEAFPSQIHGRPMHNDWPRCQEYVQHVLRLAELFVQFRKGKNDSFRGSVDFVSLLASCGWYLFEVADDAECLKLMDIARSASEGKDTLLYAKLLNTEGSARFELNELKKARPAFEAARDIRVARLPANDVLVASILANIGNVESAEGNLDEAHDLFVEAARIRESYGDREAIMLGLTYMQRGRVWFLRGPENYYRALEMYNKAEACFRKKAGQDQVHLADLYYAYGNLELERNDLNQAKRYYDMCKDLSQKNELFSPLVAATLYKLGCVEWARGNADKALSLLEKAYNVADIRSPGEVDGTIARILWRKAEILLENPIRREEGVALRKQMNREHGLIAAKLQLAIDLDDLSTDKAFDMLVPGYFR